MNFDTGSLLLCSGLYLACFFAVAQLTEKGLVPQRIRQHPLVYVLSLGIIVSTWSFYTALLSASGRGYGYAAYYIGYASAFLFAPVFLQPIFKITRTYQLNSLADLFAFRFRSPWAGTLTTIILLICTLPLLGIQIYVFAGSAGYLVPDLNTELFALAFCVAMMAFTMRYGTGNMADRDKHESVVVAIAFESLFKMAILGGLGLLVIYGVFGGFDALDQWLAVQPPAVSRLDAPFLGDNTNLTIILFFTAAIAMPHIFHMTFQENDNPNNLRVARWGLPLMLLIASFPVLPLLWAGEFLDLQMAPRYLALAVPMARDSSLLTLLTYTGGLAAACGIVVVLAMSISGMCINHLLLRVQQPDATNHLYRWLSWRKKLFIGMVLLGGYLFFILINRGMQLTDASYTSFIAYVQFLPGILTLLYWPNGNGKGFVSGLIAGFTVWALLGLWPLVTQDAILTISYTETGAINWNLIASLSLLTNIITIIGVSLLTTTSDEERSAGEMCLMNSILRPQPIFLQAKTPVEFMDKLAVPLGRETAEREVRESMKVLGVKDRDSRPYTMNQLRAQIEANLSGLLGPTMAHQIIDRFLPYQRRGEDSGMDVRFLESRLEAYPGNLSGVALDLDNLRKHHRKILETMPIGVISLDNNFQITLWNSEMEKLTGLDSEQVIGSQPTKLVAPWNKLLDEFILDEDTTHVPKRGLVINDRRHWLSLHKTRIENPGEKTARNAGLVILVEDLTETELLEAELAHAERLASIGRLAAGVAHEIGNPITGIACLAQNIRDETADGDLRRMAEQIIAQTRRTSRIVDTLVSFSHSGDRGQEQAPDHGHAHLEPVYVRDSAAEAIQLISLDPQYRDFTIENHCSEEACVFSDRQRLQQIFVNLLTNARDASPADATIHVTDSISAGMISIMVTDQGEGIPEALQARVFEPFFTTKDPGKGTGLGLALVYGITENLGGTVRIESPVDKMSRKGTRVIVTFPCYDGKPLAELDDAQAI